MSTQWPYFDSLGRSPAPVNAGSSVFAGTEGTRPYAGAAWYYAQYRPKISDEFARLLVQRLGWTRRHRVLDLGSGPGHLALRFARFLREVIAADPEPDMVAEGVRRAQAAVLDNISFVLAGSDDLALLRPSLGQFRSVVIGEAFHWMVDQDRVLRDLDPMVEAQGGIVLVTTGRILDESEPLASARHMVHEVLERYLAGVPPGPHPRGRHDPFEEILARSAFPRLETLEHESEIQEALSIDALIGAEYSTSHTLARLGTRAQAFENEIRTALRRIEEAGPVRIRRVDSGLIGRRR